MPVEMVLALGDSLKSEVVLMLGLGLFIAFCASMVQGFHEKLNT